MKLSSIFTSRALATVAIAAFSITHLLAQGATERTVTAFAVKGGVKYSHGSGAYMTLDRGVKLHKGDIVKTGPSSYADLDLGNNVGMVRVAPNSTLAIDAATVTKTGADAVTETQLTLSAGGLYAQVNKLAKGSRYEITSPKGVAGIRGTTLYSGADGRLTVETGTAGAAYPNGAAVDTFVVKDGETVSPTDRPGHKASDEQIRDIAKNLSEAAANSTNPTMVPFAAPIEPFISPNLPPFRD